MNSLVLGLQNEITRSGCDVVNVLRKAHLISSKLDLAQFDQWTQYELNGYPGPGYCPEYRKVRGVLKALNPYRGWIPTVIQNDDFEKKICERKIVNSISEIISLGKSSDDGWLICEFSGEQLEYLNSLFKPPVPMTYKLFIPSTSIADIEEKVKNTILDWTLKLEAEGIVGENMVFSEKEKNCAAGIPQTINSFFGNTSIITSPSDHVQIISGGENNITFSYSAVEQAVDEIEKRLLKERLSNDITERANELLSDIRSEIENKSKPNALKSLLAGLGNILKDAGANALSGLIQAIIQGLF